MGIRSIMVALVGVAVAGGSAFATREYLSPGVATAAPDARADLVTIVVASADIPFGQAILPQALTTISWPREAMPPGVLQDIASLVPANGKPPRRATHAIAKGDFVLSSKVSDFGDKVTLVQALGPNLRAMAVRVDAETAVGGFVTPGDFVDIVLTQGNDADLRAVTILQNVRVLGVDQDADMATDQPEVVRTVTVEVTPQQGQVLALAQEAGTLSLTLRTLDQAEDAELEAVKLGDILQQAQPEPVAFADVPAPVPVRRIVVRRANEVEVVELN
jgi:pilus assembly protein CpaB